MVESSVPLPSGLEFTARRDHEAPPVVAQLGWRYHHIGIPTTKVQANETHLEQFGLFVSGFSASPYGIEWMRFAQDSPIPELIRTVPHVAFEVEDLDAALEGQHVIYPPGSPSDGVRSAMIVHNGAPVELIWFRKPAPPSRAAEGAAEAAAEGAAEGAASSLTVAGPADSRSSTSRRVAAFIQGVRSRAPSGWATTVTLRTDSVRGLAGRDRDELTANGAHAAASDGRIGAAPQAVA